jgi:MFS transporter, ACS family, hexuronate transporter
MAIGVAPQGMARPDDGSPLRWLILALVVFATMLNYVDRQMIAILRPLIEAEFGWGDREYGHLASTFQLGAASAVLFAGWFVDRMGVRRGYAIGVVAWSGFAALHAVAAGLGQFIAVRVALGAAEAVNTPAAVKTAAEQFGPRQRSLAIGIVNAAPNLGPILTPLLIPPLALAFGWRSAFVIAGALGLAWLVAWLAVRPSASASPAAAAGTARTPWLRILADRRTIGIAIAKALTDQCWWFMLFFVPGFFTRQFGLDMKGASLPVAAIYTMAAAGALSGGWLSGRLIARGWAPLDARRAVLFGYALLILPVPLALSADGPWAAVGLIGLALFAHQGFSTNLFALVTDSFRSGIVASVVGIGAFAGNLAGAAVTEAAGRTLAAGGSYLPFFALAAGGYLAAWLVLRVAIAKPGGERCD